MTAAGRMLVGIGVALGLMSLGAAAESGRWTEQDFYRKARATRPFPIVASNDPARADTVIGGVRQYYPKKGDTFLDIARFYGLGYNEIEMANPGVDPWIPPADKPIVLPTEFVLPQAAFVGIVVNIPEMRLYYYQKSGTKGQIVSTWPVGLGRDEWRTPTAKFKVRGKTVNPTWNIPESIRKERIAEKGLHDTMIPGGSPDNPLGKYRIELTLPMYGIHGTNIPWGVGMQVSHGCVRLYPEDIEQLFPMVPVGTVGEFVYQPVKIGARGGRIYAQVVPDIYRLTPGLYREAQRILTSLGWENAIDPSRLEQAVEAQTGVPMDITRGATDKDALQTARDETPEETWRRAGN